MAKKNKPQGPSGYYAYKNKIGFVVVILALALCVFLAYENAWLASQQVYERPVKLTGGPDTLTFSLDRPGLSHGIQLNCVENAPLHCLLLSPQKERLIDQAVVIEDKDTTQWLHFTPAIAGQYTLQLTRKIGKADTVYVVIHLDDRCVITPIFDFRKW